MKEPKIPADEVERLHALRTYRLLDTEPESAFDELIELAADICGAPIALISLVDESRQWFKARVGLDAEETARSVSFCAHAILQKDLFLIPDALLDERFVDNPLVTGPPNIRFYAGAPLYNDDGFALGTLCVIDSQPRELSPFQSKALQVLRRHVVKLMEMRRRNRELLALNEELDAFTSAVSHDLVAPIRRILGYSSVLKEDHRAEFGEVALGFLQRIESQAEDMNKLVQTLLSLSRLSKGQLNIGKIDLSRLSDEILVELKASFPERKVETNVAEGLSAYADEGMMRIVLGNLLNNAFKFTSTRETSRIEVGASRQNGEQVFYVRDNGVGFDMAFKNSLFTPFSRLHSAAEFPGMGIGLTTVQRIIRRHEGEIWAESSPDAGATFFFTV